ncbi:MAG TPA: hypothetical protein PLQ56_28810 [Aggregatilineales bacterium]|nr:hypothetical protein [Aggregatilineales bacterium]
MPPNVVAQPERQQRRHGTLAARRCVPILRLAGRVMCPFIIARLTLR